MKKFIEDFKIPSLELLKHGKNLEEIYDSLNNTSIFNYKLSKNTMKKRYHETYNERNQTRGIKAALRCAWNIAQEAKQKTKDLYNPRDWDDSTDSDE